MDSATITYQIDGTTRTLRVEGGHILVQMKPSRRGKAVVTTVTVSESYGGRVASAHMFRRADYVEITRGGGDG